MAAEHLLALDAGTSGVRCVIARPGTGVIGVARRVWAYETPPGGGPLDKTFDAAAFWEAACDVTRRALAEAGLSGGDIAIAGVTTQRLGIVVLDKQGQVVITSPNVDARAFMEGLAIDATMADRVYASSGKLPSLLLAPARLRWLRAHDPERYARAETILSVGGWLAFELTGARKGERSLQGDCGLINIASRERDGRLLDELDVEASMLPALVDAQEVAGEVTAAAAQATGLAAGTPVVIAGGDTQCALMGMGIEEPGEAGIVAGWSCPVVQVTPSPRFDAGRRTWVDLHVVPDRWLVESSAADAGRMWHWWATTLLGDEQEALTQAAALAAQAPAGSDELLALLTTAPMNAGAMGLHLGGVLMTTPLAIGAAGRPQLLRAALENIAYAMRANLEQAQEVAAAPAGRVALGGGLTQVEVFGRILADVLGRPVEVAHDVQVTARGACIVAARAAGLPEDALRAEMHTITPNEGVSQGYQRRYDRWRKLAQVLDKTMQEQA